MRVIDHRRHTMRTKPGDHLSQSGVDLARRVGASMGPYDVVITSTVARAFGSSVTTESMPSAHLLACGGLSPSVSYRPRC